MWMYLPHYLSLHYYFVLICFLPTVFKCFQTTSKVSTLSIQLLYSLGAASCFLTGTQSVLVRGFLYNAYLRRFPSLWKFSFHSEASFQSFSPCWQSVENVCLPSKGAFLLFSLCDWRQMLISQAESCVEQHLPSPQSNTDKNYGIRTLNYESCSL